MLSALFALMLSAPLPASLPDQGDTRTEESELLAGEWQDDHGRPWVFQQGVLIIRESSARVSRFSYEFREVKQQPVIDTYYPNGRFNGRAIWRQEGALIRICFNTRGTPKNLADGSVFLLKRKSP